MAVASRRSSQKASPNRRVMISSSRLKTIPFIPHLALEHGTGLAAGGAECAGNRRCRARQTWLARPPRTDASVRERLRQPGHAGCKTSRTEVGMLRLGERMGIRLFMVTLVLATGLGACGDD